MANANTDRLKRQAELAKQSIAEKRKELRIVEARLKHADRSMQNRRRFQIGKFADESGLGNIEPETFKALFLFLAESIETTEELDAWIAAQGSTLLEPLIEHE